MSTTICPKCKEMFNDWPEPKCPHCNFTPSSNDNVAMAHTASRPQASQMNSTTPGQWWDCPWCGTTYHDENYNPSDTVTCGDCNYQFQTGQAINLRTTSERIETKGFLGKLLSGSSIKIPRRHFLIGKINDYERMIRLSVNPITGGDVRSLQQAQLLQMKIAEMKQELADYGG